MKTQFMSQDLWDIVEGGYETTISPEDLVIWTAAKEKELMENRMKDAKALGFIHQGVSRIIFPRVSYVTTLQQAWEMLQKQYGGYDKVISSKL